MKCPDFFQVLEFVEGRLEPGPMKKIETHLDEGCSRCRELSDWASKTLKLMKSNHILDAPEYLIRQAVDLFSQRKPSMYEWIKAKLEFDSWLTPQMQGIRGEGAGPRQQIYKTDLHKVFVMLEPQEKTQTLIGQLVTLEPEGEAAGCLVELIRGKKVVASNLTNRHGEFAFESVPKKNFDLVIHTDQEPILITC